MPERFLLQVLRSLVTHGILRSTRGVEGGYSLARPPDEITLDEVVRAFDNPLVPEVPNLEGQSEKMRACLLETLQSTSSAAFQELHNLSIGQLIASCDEH